MILPQEIIRAKRDGRRFSEAEIGEFIAGLTNGAVSEGQAAAFAMAVFFRGMTRAERVALTRAMRAPARRSTGAKWSCRARWSTSTRPAASATTSRSMLAPMVAACGAYVPMISGRGLGHTGGTLDKLEFDPRLYVAAGPDAVSPRRREAGCAIIGQTADLAPADRRLYAIRDVTATVESIPLITASILSKKLAAGLQASGDGRQDRLRRLHADARRRARSRREHSSVANGAGLPTVALITDMSEPLASAAGNAVEVLNAVDYLIGAKRDARLHAVTLALGAELLTLAGLARDRVAARAALERSLANGAAAERFERMVAALGGPANLLAKARELLPTAPVVVAAAPERRGFVLSIDAREIGLAVVELGGGRVRASDAIDPAVGLTRLAGIGAEVSADAPLALVHARNEASVAAASRRLNDAYHIGAAPPAKISDPVMARIRGAAA